MTAAAFPAAMADEFIEILSERMGGALAEGAGGAVSKVPGGARIQSMMGTVAHWWQSKYPGKMGEMLTKVGKAGGWNGVLGEFLEERAGGAMRGATGVEQGGIIANGGCEIAGAVGWRQGTQGIQPQGEV